MNTRQLIEMYHDAWTTGNISKARSCLADDLDFQGSIETFNKADDFIATLRQFKGMVRGVSVLQSFFSEAEGVLLYDCDTAGNAGIIRTAEFFTVRNNKIVEIKWVLMQRNLRI